MRDSEGGAFLWVPRRTYTVDTSDGLVCSPDQALVVEGGLSGLSVFFRRASQGVSGAHVNIELWTAPVYFNQMDTAIANTGAAAQASLLKLVLEPSTGFTGLTGTAAQVYGVRVSPAQAMGTMLFWSMISTDTATSLVGEFYVVPNHSGVLTAPYVARTMDVSSYNLMGPAAASPGRTPTRTR